MRLFKNTDKGLPYLSHKIHNVVLPEAIDTLVEQALMLGMFNSIELAQEFIEKEGIKSHSQLLPYITKKRRVNYWKRIAGVIRRVEGAYEYDPHRKELETFKENKSGSYF